MRDTPDQLVSGRTGVEEHQHATIRGRGGECACAQRAEVAVDADNAVAFERRHEPGDRARRYLPLLAETLGVPVGMTRTGAAGTTAEDHCRRPEQ